MHLKLLSLFTVAVSGGAHVGSWCADIAVTRRLSAHNLEHLGWQSCEERDRPISEVSVRSCTAALCLQVFVLTCLAYGEVQQVSQGVRDHADIIRVQHQRSTSSALCGTNPQPKKGGVGAAPSHHPRQLCIRAGGADFPVYTKAPSLPQAVSFLLEWLLFLC